MSTATCSSVTSTSSWHSTGSRSAACAGPSTACVRCSRMHDAPGLIKRNPFLGLGLSTGPGARTSRPEDRPGLRSRGHRGGDVGDERLRASLAGAFPVAGVRRYAAGEAYAPFATTWTFPPPRSTSAGSARPFTPRHANVDELPLPKNGKTRRMVIPPPALDAIRRSRRRSTHRRRCSPTRLGRPLSGQVQHDYWHPIRCAVRKPGLALFSCVTSARLHAQRPGHHPKTLRRSSAR